MVCCFSLFKKKNNPTTVWLCKVAWRMLLWTLLDKQGARLKTGRDHHVPGEFCENKLDQRGKFWNGKAISLQCFIITNIFQHTTEQGYVQVNCVKVFRMANIVEGFIGKLLLKLICWKVSVIVWKIIFRAVVFWVDSAIREPPWKGWSWGRQGRGGSSAKFFECLPNFRLDYVSSSSSYCWLVLYCLEWQLSLDGSSNLFSGKQILQITDMLTGILYWR